MKKNYSSNNIFDYRKNNDIYSNKIPLMNINNKSKESKIEINNNNINIDDKNSYIKSNITNIKLNKKNNNLIP